MITLKHLIKVQSTFIDLTLLAYKLYDVNNKNFQLRCLFKHLMLNFGGRGSYNKPHCRADKLDNAHMLKFIFILMSFVCCPFKATINALIQKVSYER